MRIGFERALSSIFREPLTGNDATSDEMGKGEIYLIALFGGGGDEMSVD